jgi:hypothetical protein
MCVNVNVGESTSHAAHTDTDDDTDATHATGATPAADAATDDDTRQLPDIRAYVHNNNFGYKGQRISLARTIGSHGYCILMTPKFRI